MDGAGQVVSVKALIVEENIRETTKRALPLVTELTLPFCPIQFYFCSD